MRTDQDEKYKEIAKRWCLAPEDHAWDEILGFAYDIAALERNECATMLDLDARGRGNTDIGALLAYKARLIRERGKQ